MNRIVFIFLALVFAAALTTRPAQAGAFGLDSAFTSSNLPIVIIDTHGQTIVDEPKITADMSIIDNGVGKRNAVTDTPKGYAGKIGIEIRGSSSQQFPKKQYAVETHDSAGNSVDASILGMPAESDWILGAEYNDKSLMRDPLLFAIARSTGRYASRVRYCELILNGDYVGVYTMKEKIKRNKNRVNISKLTAADTTGDALTGGYIVKADKVEGAETAGWYSQYPMVAGGPYKVYYQYHYPKPEDLVPRQITYITGKVSTFESAVHSASGTDTALGYPHYIDVNSAVDMFLINELSRNVDSYRLSAFMYKDKDSKGAKFVMGPPWDYSLGFGNCDYYSASAVQGFQIDYFTTNSGFINGDSYPMPFWWKTMYGDPPFRAALAKRWNDLRQKQFATATVTALIDSMAGLINEGQTRNFVRWPILGVYVWPNQYVGATYVQEIAYLKNWVSGRLDWIDSEFPLTSAGENASVRPTGTHLLRSYPNPFNPATTLQFVTSERGHVRLAAFNMLGQEVSTLFDGMAEPGVHEMRFDASALASGVYVCRLFAGGSVESRKVVLLR